MRKTKKEDVGHTHGTRGQEDQLPGVEEKAEHRIKWHHHQLNLP